MPLPCATLGKTGVEVSRLGLGGEGILRTFGQEKKAAALIRAALDLGITYFESARAYAGSESYYGAALGTRRKEIFLATKSHARSASGAEQHLRESLSALRTDWIDLWQIHDLRTEEDMEALFGPRGAMETFARARQDGVVRFLGITGHENPAILERGMDSADFDAVLLPVNPAEPAHLPFHPTTVLRAAEKGMWVAGMKTLARGALPRLTPDGDPGPFLRYALGTEGVDVIVVGCDSGEQLAQNVRAVEGAPAPAPEERASLEAAVSPLARQLLYYKP
ncbi:MAG TPA: aldo/keto reductase [Candidatus Deferrimicrobiaceae bacterium]|nr:aldo/keto reductase [Candidatus Deferrimicrobiaceae bacterium]